MNSSVENAGGRKKSGNEGEKTEGHLEIKKEKKRKKRGTREENERRPDLAARKVEKRMKRECRIDTTGYYNYTPRSDTAQEILSVRVYPYCCYSLPRYDQPIVLRDFNAFFPPSPDTDHYFLPLFSTCNDHHAES